MSLVFRCFAVSTAEFGLVLSHVRPARAREPAGETEAAAQCAEEAMTVLKGNKARASFGLNNG